MIKMGIIGIIFIKISGSFIKNQLQCLLFYIRYNVKFIIA